MSFCNKFIFYGKELLAPCLTPKLEDDTFSPPPLNPNVRPPSAGPELPEAPINHNGAAVQMIRQTLESTGDLKPQEAFSAPVSPAAETFMVPPDSLQEALAPAGELDALPDFDSADDDSLDLDSSESLSLGDGLLDDLDDD